MFDKLKYLDKLQVLRDYALVPKNQIYTLSAFNGQSVPKYLYVDDINEFVTGLLVPPIKLRKFLITKKEIPSSTLDIYIKVDNDLNVTGKNFESDIFKVKSLVKYVSVLEELGTNKRSTKHLKDIVVKLGTSSLEEIGGCSYFQEIFLNRTLNNEIKRMNKEIEGKSKFKNETNVVSQETKESILLRDKKQIILYGPAGTGKTYNTKNIIVSHAFGNVDNIDEKYKQLQDEGRVKFVTFHQSFAYEDFIEGIKPNLNEEGGDISYKRLLS